MSKRILAFLPLGILMSLTLSVTAFAATEPDKAPYTAVGSVVFILSVAVIVAFTVMNVMKRKKTKQ